MLIDDAPALLVRDGKLVRVRAGKGVRTVVETTEPVAVHPKLSWIAVRRSPRLVDVLDLVSGDVLAQLRAAGTGGEVEPPAR